jgi:hypothetical protein
VSGGLDCLGRFWASGCRLWKLHKVRDLVAGYLNINTNVLEIDFSLLGASEEPQGGLG